MPAFELLYGRNAVLEALRAGRRRIYRVLISRNAQERGALSAVVDSARAKAIPVLEVERADMDSISRDAKHHGVMAEASPYPYVVLDQLIAQFSRAEGYPPLVLVLDYVQDPQNLGTLMRTAEAIGVDGVIIPRRRAAGITPAVVNASAGATEYLHIAEVTNLVRAMGELKRSGLWLAGLEQITGASWHVDADLSGPLGLVVGSEGAGMSRLVRETCDFFIQLPMVGKVNSLNVAVAGSVALYEIWRQRSRRM